MLARRVSAASLCSSRCSLSSSNRGYSRVVWCRFQTHQERAAPLTTTVGQPLTPDEAASLSAVCQLNHRGTGAEQRVVLQRPADTVPAILAAGAAKQHSNHQELEGAILAAEQAYLGTLESPMGHSSLDTRALQHTAMWQPMFASSGGFPRLLYIPVPEYFALSKAQQDGAIDIITELGPITTHFLGTCSWSSPHELEYAISQVVVQVGSWKGTLPFKLANTLSFFYHQDKVACARSKLGGTMLMVADPAGSAKYL